MKEKYRTLGDHIEIVPWRGGTENTPLKKQHLSLSLKFRGRQFRALQVEGASHGPRRKRAENDSIRRHSGNGAGDIGKHWILKAL